MGEQKVSEDTELVGDAEGADAVPTSVFPVGSHALSELPVSTTSSRCMILGNPGK